MSIANSQNQLELPSSLETQLHAYKRRVWTVKLTEAACIAAFGLLLAYLTVFVLDRVWDTPQEWRGLILGIAAFISCCIPMALYRWVWRKRRLEQLARLISRRMPQLGDQLLGIIELVHSDGELARSRALCEAAIRQTAEDTQKQDLGAKAVPQPRHRQWGLATALPLALAIGLLIICQAAASNAWMRFLTPWKKIDRFTFAQVDKLPANYVVPHGEPVVASLKVKAESQWQPEEGKLYVGKQPPIIATLQDGAYTFPIPPQLTDTKVFLRIGDATQSVRLKPTMRPKLEKLTATYALPDYLQRKGKQTKQGEGGSIFLVKGSQLELNALINAQLSTALVNGKPVTPNAANITTDSMVMNDSAQIEFRWEDEHGLAGAEPFVLGINARDDEAPLVACEDLPRSKVVLDSEQLTFTVRAQDDFGIKRVGFEWVGVESSGLPSKIKGERILGVGGPEAETLELRGAFSGKDLGIDPQPMQTIQVRIFVEDYFVGRPRAYSLPCTFHVMTPAEHAVYITEQLSKWHRIALETRDREMQLHEKNKQFRDLDPKDLDKAETRRELEKQAHAERANSRRLNTLVNVGEDLVRQAMRNPEFGVGHLEKWAEMLKIMKDISTTRMPSVAELLKDAAQSPLAMNNNNAEKNVVDPAELTKRKRGEEGDEENKEEGDGKGKVQKGDNNGGKNQPGQGKKSQNQNQLGKNALGKGGGKQGKSNQGKSNPGKGSESNDGEQNNDKNQKSATASAGGKGKGSKGSSGQKKDDEAMPVPVKPDDPLAKLDEENKDPDEDEKDEAKKDEKNRNLGKNRNQQANAAKPKKGKKAKPAPGVGDTESTQGIAQTPEAQPENPEEKKKEEEEAKKDPTGIKMLQTMVVDTTPPKKKKPGAQRPPNTPAEKKVAEAIKKQADLLAEFDKIAKELERVLANLEGSTLVKRLKSASRMQYKIGGEIGEQVAGSFGVATPRVPNQASQVFADLTKKEAKESQNVSYIMDDLQAFAERRQLVRFQTVLEEMRKEDVIGALRQLGDDVKKESGLSIAQTEFWADTLDRWADNLVDPACSGKCNCNCKGGSLPPDIVLEVLLVLEAEVNLREKTRVAEQSKAAVKVEDWTKEAQLQSKTQLDLQKRIDVVHGKIAALPDAQQLLAKELKLMQMVSAVMKETVEILASPNTGKQAIAAETEVIELLLKSKKFNPKKPGGGGGGSDPGGGGGGSTTDAALALIGLGANEKEVREERDVNQTTGVDGPTLPEEFRSGLDEYFSRLERGAGSP